MAAANAHAYALGASPTSPEHTLFKEDRPRHIDRFISFFGDGGPESTDICGEGLLDWSER